MPTITSFSKDRFPIIRIVLAFVLILNLSVLPVLAQVGTVGKIKIVIVSGEGSVHRIGKAAGPVPAVQVQDANGQPISGATVLFVAPEGGPGAVFAGGLTTLRVTTDEKGMAVARGFQPNNIAGSFQVRVDASYQDQTAGITVNQTNAKKSSNAKTYAILGIAAGAGLGAAMAAKGKGGSSSTPSNNNPPVTTTTTITTGTVTVGPPQ